MKIGRRGFFGLLGGAIAGAHLPKLPIVESAAPAFYCIDPRLVDLTNRMAYGLAITLHSMINEEFEVKRRSRLHLAITPDSMIDEDRWAYLQQETA